MVKAKRERRKGGRSDKARKVASNEYGAGSKRRQGRARRGEYSLIEEKKLRTEYEAPRRFEASSIRLTAPMARYPWGAPLRGCVGEKPVSRGAPHSLLWSAFRRLWSAPKKSKTKSRYAVKTGEMKDMNATLKGVWKYLTAHVPEDGKFIPYSIIRDAVGKKSRHAIAYAVEKLCRQGIIRIYDRKIYVLEAYKDA